MTTPNSGEETFISHLIELRDRLVKASIGIALVCLGLMIWPGPAQIYDFIAQPMIASLPVGSKMIATGVISPFLVPMKVTLVISIILSLPWVLYQLWAFVAPGLYAHEKRLIAPLVISSSLLFMSGVAFCYFLVFGRVFQFIAEFSPVPPLMHSPCSNVLKASLKSTRAIWFAPLSSWPKNGVPTAR